MDDRVARELIDGLEEIGWTRKGDNLISPGQTMWLNAGIPWPGSAEEFRERMLGRAERMRRNLAGCAAENVVDFQRTLDDVIGLIEVIDQLNRNNQHR